MDKQYCTCEISSLLNPPLLSKFAQFQEDLLENVFASKKYPLGRSKISNLPDKLLNRKHGVCTKQGDSAFTLIYPSNFKTLHSTYGDTFYAPNCSQLDKVPYAGLKSEGKDLTDNTGTEMKEILKWISNNKSTVHSYNRREENDNRIRPVVTSSCNDENSNTEEKKQSAIQNQKPSLLDELWLLLKQNSYLNPTEFSSFLKAYVKNFPRVFTFVDLQRILKNFGTFLSLPVLENILRKFDVFDDSFISAEKFLKAVKEDFNLTKDDGDRKFLLCFPCDEKSDNFKTTASVIGDHKSEVSSNTAGIPTIQRTKRPKLRSVLDATDYGDIKDASVIIQPSLFEKYGVYDDDLGALRSKQECELALEDLDLRSLVSGSRHCRTQSKKQ